VSRQAAAVINVDNIMDNNMKVSAAMNDYVRICTGAAQVKNVKRRQEWKGWAT